MEAPKEIKRLNESGLQITWKDGVVSELSSKELREACPCAGCKEARGDTSHSAPLTSKPRSLKVLSSNLTEELTLKKIWGVGTYALGMEWGDGHSTGIYTFDMLRELKK